jgi:hypothetical protein
MGRRGYKAIDTNDDSISIEIKRLLAKGIVGEEMQVHMMHIDEAIKKGKMMQ